MSHKALRVLEEIAGLPEEEKEEILALLESRQELKWTQISQKAFQEDWSSREDSIYDRLQTS